MKTKPEILLVEDDAGLAASLVDILVDEGYAVTHRKRGDDGLEAARTGNFHLVLSDLKLPGINGLGLVRELHQARPLLPIILMTAHGTTETAIEATRHGAYDYLLKPFEPTELLKLVEKTLANSRLSTAPVEVGTPVSGRDTIVGQSRKMQEIFKELGRIAATPVTVLIRGETGTGKELIARALVQHGDRSRCTFVAVNCAAIPDTLLESELFGHEKGAFTGAEARRIGRFEQADGGTLFLDEIGDMSLGCQAKLLRVLQEKKVQRLGGRETLPVNVRIIAATHRDLETTVREGGFREDLFYRLSVVVIELPPLRDRREDIPPLVHYFINRLAIELGLPAVSIQPEALAFLQEQAWPGNVRQLENAVRRALLNARGYTITLEQARQIVGSSATRQRTDAPSLSGWIASHLDAASHGQSDNILEKLVGDLEKEAVRQAYELSHGNLAKAARWLGISRLTMREKLRQFGLYAPEKDDSSSSH